MSIVKNGKYMTSQTGFHHNAKGPGYNVDYYGYTYSLVFTTDIYVTVFKEKPLDLARDKKYYSDGILSVGENRDYMDSLKGLPGHPLIQTHS